MKKLFPIFLLLVLCLTGCSSSKLGPNDDVTIKWENGVMSWNGKTFSVDEYAGYNAFAEAGSGGLNYTMMIDAAKDVTNISCNYQGILEENMDKYKDCFYYSEYLGSKLTIARRVDENNFLVCQANTNGQNGQLVATYAEEYLSSVPLTNGQVYVDFGSFIFGNAYDSVIVRPTEAIVAGVARVSQDTYNCTTPVTVIQDNKEYQLMKGSSAKYDYYTYDGYLIQLAGGLDISSYVKFK